MFGRRKRVAQGERVTVAPALVNTITPPQQAAGYVTGWAPAGHGQAASEQIGAYSAPMLTMRAGNIVERQKVQGVESLSSGWCIPGRLSSATGYAITMRAGNAQEVQKIAGGSNGQLGLIGARVMRANVTAQSVRQSGLAAVQWAQGLTSNPQS